MQCDQERPWSVKDNLNNDIITDGRCGSDYNACLVYEVNEIIAIIVLYYRLKNCYVLGNMFIGKNQANDFKTKLWSNIWVSI